MIQHWGKIASPLTGAPPRSGAQGAGVCDDGTAGIYFYLISWSVSGCFIQERNTCKSQRHFA